MAIFNKPIDSIKFSELDILVQAREPESIILEYKEALEGSNKDKRNLARHVSAFGNSQGGHILIGIEEDGPRPVHPIKGLPRLLDGVKVEEWADQVLNANLAPRVAVGIRPIELPTDPNRCVLMIAVPQSHRAPHMVTHDGENRYYKRQQNQTLRAEEYEVRELFERSRRMRDEVYAFFARKQYVDPESPGFGINDYTGRLATIDREGEDGEQVQSPPKSVVSFVAIPTRLEEYIDTASEEFKAWMAPGQRRYPPKPSDIFLPINLQKDLYNGHIRWDYYILRRSAGQPWQKFLLIERNGYVEYAYGDGGEYKGLNLLGFTHMVGCFWMFLGFVRDLYRFSNIPASALINFNLARVAGTHLGGYADGWEHSLRPLSRRSEQEVCWDLNIQFSRELTPQALTDMEVEALVREVAARIGTAYGQEIPRCFNYPGGEFPVNKFSP